MEALIYLGNVNLYWIRVRRATFLALMGISVSLTIACDQLTRNSSLKNDKSGKMQNIKKVSEDTIFGCGPSLTETETPSELKSGEKVYLIVDMEPEFPEGIKAMNDFIAKNLKYPPAALKTNVNGRVFTSFIVGKDGTISDITILKGLGSGCDEEAIRVVSSFPKWKPGSSGGKAVYVRYNLPIKFAN